MEPKTSTPGRRYQALIDLLRLSDSIWNAGQYFFRRWDLSSSQFNLLNLCNGAEKELTQMEISRELLMHRSNVTGLVDRLEKKGLVRRIRGKADRRTFAIVLTEKGKQLMSRILPEYHESTDKVFGNVSGSDLEIFSEVLKRVNRKVDELTETMKAEK